VPDNQFAINALILTAAARPTITPKNEKAATTIPFLIPLKMASANNPNKQVSKNMNWLFI
jgi:hypothetical protein